MEERDLEALVSALRRGELPPGATALKENRVRRLVRAGEVLVKLWARPSRAPAREARRLREAAARGVRVPEPLGFGADWIATRWIEGRPATPADLDAVLEAVARLHDAGFLHRDLHLGNLLVARDGGVVITDLQRAWRLPRVPAWLRLFDLGYLAFSCGEPFPPRLAPARAFAWWRAHTHWRSRTRRCLRTSGGFVETRLEAGRGVRRRALEEEELRRAIDRAAAAPPLKRRRSTCVSRAGPFVLKRYASPRAARRAWVRAWGLEVRGFRTGALAWVGPWLVLEDLGPTLEAWVEAEFSRADAATRRELAERLGDLLADLHRRGIYHGDLKATNVAWRPGGPPGLLDVEDVRFGVRVSRRRRVKNLAQLNAALPDAVPAELRRLALARYLERSGYRDDARRLLEDVVRLSLRRRHRWSGCGATRSTSPRAVPTPPARS